MAIVLYRIIPYCIPRSVFLRVAPDGYLIVLGVLGVSAFSYVEEMKKLQGDGAGSCEVSRDCVADVYIL